MAEKLPQRASEFTPEMRQEWQELKEIDKELQGIADDMYKIYQLATDKKERDRILKERWAPLGRKLWLEREEKIKKLHEKYGEIANALVAESHLNENEENGKPRI